MKKSLLFTSILVAVIATGASAGMSLTQLPYTNPGTNNSNAASGYGVQGITDDGAYVVATADNAGAANGIMVIKVSDLTTSTYNPKVNTSGRGIAQAPAGLMLAGAVGSNNALARAYDAGPGANYYPLTSSGGGSDAMVAQQNAMSTNPTTGDGWMVGTSYGTNNGMAWKYVAGVKTSVNAFWQKTGSGKTTLTGVSNTGLAVGTDQPSGARAITADVANNGNVTAIPLFANATGAGQGNGMSANGAFASGYMVPGAGFSDDSLHAFRYTVGGTTAELLPAGGDIAALVQQSNAFDAANDGTIVGFTYNGKDANGNSFSGYRATVWQAGSTNGVLLQDLLAAGGVGLGGFSSLERVVSVTADGKTFAGRGVLTSDGSYRGFVVTIPEPATMAFLALGGLAMLRRRH